MKRFELVVPTVVAVIVVVAVLRVAGLEAGPGEAGYLIIDSAPTPYSHAHALVQSRPGPAEELPPQF